MRPEIFGNGLDKSSPYKCCLVGQVFKPVLKDFWIVKLQLYLFEREKTFDSSER